MTKRQIELEIARDLCMPIKEVSAITTSFIDALRDAIAKKGNFSIDRLGVFKAKRQGDTIWVDFQPSKSLKKMLEENKGAYHEHYKRRRRDGQIRGG